MVIYNILGQCVRTLINEEQSAGYYRAVWDARSESGELVSSGIYIYQIIAGDFIKTKRMVLMR
ncbi:T9SS type A sorting domain-containing protein [bacterium]|nr:T9SS type A sorting domain-containing protein [bacterium]